MGIDSLAVHEILDGFLRWITLVDELVLIVAEVTRMILEVILLASKELVNFSLPGSVESLSLWLRTVTNVVLIGQICIGVVHVLAIVDVEVGLLLILDFEQISLSRVAVLPQVGLDRWLVEQTALLHQSTLINPSQTEEGEHLPAKGHILKVVDLRDRLKA